MSKEPITILIIDDEEDFSFFVRKNLERIENYRVLSANNGSQGLQMLRDYRPDLILLDIMMPGLDGFSVLRAIRSNPSTARTPVIMLTGKDDEESKRKAARLKNTDYIVKPTEAEEVRARIEQALKG